MDNRDSNSNKPALYRQVPASRDPRACYFYLYISCATILSLLGWGAYAFVLHPSLSTLAIFCLLTAFFGSRIPAVLEDFGWFLAYHKRRYNLSEAILLVTHQLYRVFSFRSACASMGALRLAQLALLRGDLATAEPWAIKCLEMSEKDRGWWCRLYALSTLGELRFEQGNVVEAEKTLLLASELHRSGGTVPLVCLQNKIDRFQAENMDLLGKICLQRSEFAHAKNYFEQSQSLRRLVPALVSSADAYGDFASGLLLLTGDRAKSTQHFYAALRQFPTQSKHPEERNLAIQIAKQVMKCSEQESDQWAQANDLILLTTAKGLHPKLLGLASS